MRNYRRMVVGELPPKLEASRLRLKRWHSGRGRLIVHTEVYRTEGFRLYGKEVSNLHLVATDSKGYVKDYFWHKDKECWRGQMGDGGFQAGWHKEE